MTAKRRRHKFDKKRKSDEHSHPRRSEEADRGSEGSRSRTGLIPRKREGQDADDEGIVEGLYELNVIEPTEYSVLRGYPQGAKLYLNDYEKELLDTVQREFEEKLAGGQEAVRTAGSSDDEASS